MSGSRTQPPQDQRGLSLHWHEGAGIRPLRDLAGGATINEFVDWCPSVDERQAPAVLEHEAKALRTAVAR